MYPTTQNDLSANVVKIDYDAILQCAEIAYAESKYQIAKALDNLITFDMNNNNTARYIQARTLVEKVKRLSIAADTYSTLLEGKSRSDKVLVNIPEIKEN